MSELRKRITFLSGLGLFLSLFQAELPVYGLSPSLLGQMKNGGGASRTSINCSTQPQDPRCQTPDPDSSGDSRGECEVAEGNTLPLQAFVPSSFSESLTTSKRPTLWFYSPYTISPGTRVELTIYNRSGENPYNPIYDDNISGIGPGIQGIALPSTVPTLVAGGHYQWFVKVYCDDTSPASSGGFINLTTYSSANDVIWYDHINTLANTLQANPNSPLRSDWEDLLESAGLEDFADQNFRD